jgi:hypothetical protein
MVDEESFLRRWSRRKRERADEAPPAAPAHDAPPANAAAPVASPDPRRAATPPPELPPLDSLQGLASDYREFLKPAVDEDLRRSALKKLFHDPHFNIMDGLDVYIDDYSKPDPIPQSMLEGLLARHVGFADPAEKPADGDPDPRAAEATQPAGESPAPEVPVPVPDDTALAAAPAPDAQTRAEEEKH